VLQAAAVVTLPFDVIKTHRQIELGMNFAHGKQVTSTWKLIMQLYRHKGISALFAGRLLHLYFSTMRHRFLLMNVIQLKLYFAKLLSSKN